MKYLYGVGVEWHDMFDYSHAGNYTLDHVLYKKRTDAETIVNQLTTASKNKDYKTLSSLLKLQNSDLSEIVYNFYIQVFLLKKE